MPVNPSSWLTRSQLLQQMLNHLAARRFEFFIDRYSKFALCPILLNRDSLDVALRHGLRKGLVAHDGNAGPLLTNESSIC